jgi:hypothetical protein
MEATVRARQPDRTDALTPDGIGRLVDWSIGFPSERERHLDDPNSHSTDPDDPSVLISPAGQAAARLAPAEHTAGTLTRSSGGVAQVRLVR